MLQGSLGFANKEAAQSHAIEPQTSRDCITILQPGAHGIESLVMSIAVIVECRGFQTEIDRGLPKGTHRMLAVWAMDDDGRSLHGVPVTGYARVLFDPGQFLQGYDGGKKR